MFEVSKPRSRATQISLLASFSVHCIVIFLWLNRPPIFVQPSSIAWGMRGNSENVVYLAQTSEQSPTKSEAKKLHFRAKAKRKQAAPPPEQVIESARAGATNGSLFNGPATGVEATPALPMVFPDPEIHPWQLSGLQGDVIVEVTIDEKGNVTDTKVLQSLQQDIDDKVIATLKGWRFTPAKVDGVAISSRQDVHFHFPS